MQLTSLKHGEIGGTGKHSNSRGIYTPYIGLNLQTDCQSIAAFNKTQWRYFCQWQAGKKELLTGNIVWIQSQFFSPGWLLVGLRGAEAEAKGYVCKMPHKCFVHFLNMEIMKIFQGE